ncbi:DUF2252 domain-containing protein [Kamptonema animale CS-326]|jgi:uncharacterized protein (DUF2252 family)|uniref:DUF2252 domain-containing protein n=1 Tax=Kamptonema animale TaxID=92934 RepID=UPI00232DEE7E|nr:DUF2252 domain-containing protein [Kamptonema animale]MDB9514230.1 DUF2252 domain-containing protein [Kamptonema animale CS-326]
MTDRVLERIKEFNQGRNPERLLLKYKAMASNSFVFFRGTCHLFYEDWPLSSPLNDAPPVWICGDLHLENFGSYKGDNRLVYFDINDFDEGALAPATWEITRFLTSILVGADTLGVNQSEAISLCHCFLKAYTDALALGTARTVEAATAEGMVADLLESLKLRRRKDFLDRRTEEKKGKRRFIIDNKRTAAVSSDERLSLESLVKNWAAKQKNPAFFEVLDVGVRIAGTGSLGVKRYVILVEGKGSPDDNYLLDIKQALPSSLTHYLKLPQPKWVNEAERIVSIQKRMEAMPQSWVSPVEMEGELFVLRGLQPTQDKVSLDQWNGKLGRLEKVLKTMGEITAWNQLRSSGRQGSAIADELIYWAENAAQWQTYLLDYAQAYFNTVEANYQEFSAAIVEEKSPL